MGKEVALPALKDVVTYAKHLHQKTNFEMDGEWLVTNALKELYPAQTELIRNIFETKEGINKFDDEEAKFNQLEELINDAVETVTSDFKLISNKDIQVKCREAILKLCSSEQLIKNEFSVFNAPIQEKSRSLIILGGIGCGKSVFLQIMAKVFYLTILNELDFNLHFVNADSVPSHRIWFSREGEYSLDKTNEGIVQSIINACANHQKFLANSHFCTESIQKTFELNFKQSQNHFLFGDQFKIRRLMTSNSNVGADHSSFDMKRRIAPKPSQQALPGQNHRSSKNSALGLEPVAEDEMDATRISNYTNLDWIIFDGSLNFNSQHMINLGWIDKLIPLIEGSF